MSLIDAFGSEVARGVGQRAVVMLGQAQGIPVEMSPQVRIEEAMESKTFWNGVEASPMLPVGGVVLGLVGLFAAVYAWRH